MCESSDKIGGLTFEELQRLFKNDPVEYEEHRKRTIEAAILKARPESQDRLRGLIKTYDNLTKDKSPEDSLNVAVIMLDKNMLDLSSSAAFFAKTVTKFLGKGA